MKGRTLSLIISIFLVITGLLLTGTYHVLGQDQELLLEPDETGVEVLLNDNGLSFDTSVLVELVYDGYVNIPGWSPYQETFSMDIDPLSGPFLFRSHYNSDLGVIMFKENITSLLKEQHNITMDMDGWTISIVIPGTKVMDNPYDHMNWKLRPDVEIDMEAVNWSTAMEIELDWLVSIGVINGLTEKDIKDISTISELGSIGFEKRVFFFHFNSEWIRFDRVFFNEIGLGKGNSETYSLMEFPDSVAPTTDEKQFTVSISMVIFVSSILISILISSFFYHRVDRAVRLNNARRKLIYELILNEPGIHFSAVMNELNLKPGVASYHINRLEKMEYIKSYQDGMYRRFYLFEQKIEMKMSLSELQKLIVNVIEDEPGISQVDISRMIGKSKVVINYHVRFLRDLGLLIMERDGRKTHCFLTTRGLEFAHV